MNVLSNRQRFGVPESHERVRDIESNAESKQIKGEKMKLPQIRKAPRQDVERGPAEACILVRRLLLDRMNVKAHVQTKRKRINGDTTEVEKKHPIAQGKG